MKNNVLLLLAENQEYFSQKTGYGSHHQECTRHSPLYCYFFQNRCRWREHSKRHSRFETMKVASLTDDVII